MPARHVEPFKYQTCPVLRWLLYLKTSIQILFSYFSASNCDVSQIQQSPSFCFGKFRRVGPGTNSVLKSDCSIIITKNFTLVKRPIFVTCKLMTGTNMLEEERQNFAQKLLVHTVNGQTNKH